jgi:RHS repeat-associated protein
VLPNQKSYQFFYDPKYGLLNKIFYPSGGYVRYVWGVNANSDNVTYPDSNTSGTQGTCTAKFSPPAVLHRYVSYGGAEVQQQDFTYSTTWSTSGPLAWTSKQTIVTTTDLSKTGHPSFQTTYIYEPWAIGDPPNVVSTLADQVPQEQTVTYMDWSGTTLKTVTKTWSSVDFIASQQVALGPSGSATQTSKTVYTYPPEDYRGSCPQPSQVDDYDFGQGAPGSLLRSVAATYQMLTTPLGTTDVCTPSSVITYGGGGSRAAETDYAYDQTATSPISAIQHDNANYPSGSGVTRGNVTTKTQKCFVGSITCADSVTTYGYDQTGQVLSMKDPCGNGTCSDVTGSAHTTQYSYADSYTVLSGGQNVGYTPSGNTNAYLTKITDPVGHTANFTYDFNNGQLTISQDQNLQYTNYLYYDSLNRPTQVSYPDGGQTEVSYNDALPSPSVTTCQLIAGTAGAPCSAASPPAGWKTTLATRDGLGNVVQTKLVSDPDGPTFTVTSYDGNGRPYQVYNPTRCNPPTTNCTQATWGITSYTYDALGRTQQVAEPDGSTVSTTYSGNQSTVTDEVGNQRKSQTDSLGRLRYVWEAPNNTGYNYETDYVYDALNNLQSVNQKGGSSNSANWRTRTFGYDSLSRLTSAINPESGTISYTYDLNGNLSSKTAPKAGQTGTQLTTHNYTYDALNRLLKETTLSPATIPGRYAYDGATLTSCTQDPPIITSPTNLIGRRSAMCGGQSGSSWSYDQMGRPVIDSRTNYASGFVRKNYSVHSTYYKDGSLDTLTYPSGDVITYYMTGGAGRYLSATDSTNAYAYAATYESNGSLSGVIHSYWGPATGITTNVWYNNRFQPVWFDAQVPGQPSIWELCYDFHQATQFRNVCKFSAYTAGDNGDVFQILNYSNQNLNAVYVYDPLNRIAQANTISAIDQGCWGETYTIDPWGNLTNRAGVTGMGGCSTEGLSAIATTKNQLGGIGLQYDAAGNVTTDNLGNIATYDAENRISTIAGFAYYYDADGARMEKSSGSSGTMYWLGPSGENLAETDLTGTINEEYIYFNGERVARVDRPSGTVHYYLSDHLGSASAITDARGNVQEQYYYYPYGGLISSSGSDPNHYKFTGRERDAESNLDYFGARHYGSALGRFMKPDEAFNDQNAHDPQSWNLYSYVRNNPLRYTDPSGNACVQDSPGNWHNDNSGGESCEDVNKNNQNAQPSVTVTATPVPTELEYRAAYATQMGYPNAMGMVHFNAFSSKGLPIVGAYNMFLGMAGSFSPEEESIADALEAEGYEVTPLEVIQGQKNPDALVNGVRTEFKTVTVAGPNTLKNQIQDGLKQAPNVVVDARSTSISAAQAMQQIRMVEGNMGSVQGRVTILTNEGMVKH